MVRTMRAERLPIVQISNFTDGHGNLVPLNGYVKILTAYYVPYGGTLLLQTSSIYPDTRITFFSTQLDGQLPVTSCLGGSADGGGGLLPGCYPKNAIVGTTPVWLVSPAGNPCGSFIQNGVIVVGMSRLTNATLFSSPNDPTRYKSGVQFQCRNPLSTEFLTLLPPFIDLSLGPIPDFEELRNPPDCCSGWRFNSPTNMSVPLENVGTLPVTLTGYNITGSDDLRYSRVGWAGPTIQVHQNFTVFVTTDSAHLFAPGSCYVVLFSTSRYLRFLSLTFCY